MPTINQLAERLGVPASAIGRWAVQEAADQTTVAARAAMECDPMLSPEEAAGVAANLGRPMTVHRVNQIFRKHAEGAAHSRKMIRLSKFCDVLDGLRSYKSLTDEERERIVRRSRDGEGATINQLALEFQCSRDVIVEVLAEARERKK